MNRVIHIFDLSETYLITYTKRNVRMNGKVVVNMTHNK